jgi:hypothetical protein
MRWRSRCFGISWRHCAARYGVRGTPPADRMLLAMLARLLPRAAVGGIPGHALDIAAVAPGVDRPAGDPPKSGQHRRSLEELVAIVVRLAQENPRWGYLRIVVAGSRGIGNGRLPWGAVCVADLSERTGTAGSTTADAARRSRRPPPAYPRCRPDHRGGSSSVLDRVRPDVRQIQHWCCNSVSEEDSRKTLAWWVRDRKSRHHWSSVAQQRGNRSVDRAGLPSEPATRAGCRRRYPTSTHEFPLAVCVRAAEPGVHCRGSMRCGASYYRTPYREQQRAPRRL